MFIQPVMQHLQVYCHLYHQTETILFEFFSHHQFVVISVIYISSYICTDMCLYKNIVCTNGMMAYMCPCALLASSSMVYYWVNTVWCASVVTLPSSIINESLLLFNIEVL